MTEHNVPTLTVPIGPNCSLDGGPFENFDADGIDGDTDPAAGTLSPVDGSVAVDEETVESLADEMAAGEPVAIHTGDADPPMFEIEIPLVDGFAIEAHRLGERRIWTSKDLRHGTESTRRRMEERLRHNGGTITPA